MWKKNIDGLGFQIIEQALRATDLDSLRHKLERSDLKRSRAGVRHALKHACVAKVAEDPRVLSLARDVLGDQAFPFRATLFDKSPKSNWLVVWHQDTALPLQERRDTPGWGPWSTKDGVIYAHAPAEALRQVLALRIHLDDSTSENGPLRVLPATHTNGVLSDDAIHQLAAGISPVNCLCSAGDILAMRPLIVHSSSKSLSDAPRRILHIEYAASRKFDGLELGS